MLNQFYFNIAGLYLTYANLIDAIIVFVMLLALAQFTFTSIYKNKYGRGIAREGKMIAVAVALALTFGFVMFAQQTGFTFGALGGLAAAIIFFVFGVFIYQLLRDLMGDKNAGCAAALAFILMYTFFMLPYAHMYQYLQANYPVVWSLFGLGYLFAIIALVLCIGKLFKGVGSSGTAPAPAPITQQKRPSQPAPEKPNVPATTPQISSEDPHKKKLEEAVRREKEEKQNREQLEIGVELPQENDRVFHEKEQIPIKAHIRGGTGRYKWKIELKKRFKKMVIKSGTGNLVTHMTKPLDAGEHILRITATDGEQMVVGDITVVTTVEPPHGEFWIAGKLETHDGKRPNLQNTTLILMHPDGNPRVRGEWVRSVDGSTIGDRFNNATFMFRGIKPGSYVVTAIKREGDKTVQAVQTSPSEPIVISKEHPTTDAVIVTYPEPKTNLGLDIQLTPESTPAPYGSVVKTRVLVSGLTKPTFVLKVFMFDRHNNTAVCYPEQEITARGANTVVEFDLRAGTGMTQEDGASWVVAVVKEGEREKKAIKDLLFEPPRQPPNPFDARIAFPKPGTEIALGELERTRGLPVRIQVQNGVRPFTYNITCDGLTSPIAGRDTGPLLEGIIPLSALMPGGLIISVEIADAAGVRTTIGTSVTLQP